MRRCEQAVTSVNQACGSAPSNTGSFTFPPSCSAQCAAVFNPFFGNGNGACFAALGLSYAQTSQFSAFGALCAAAGGAGGGVCPPPPPCIGGSQLESRYVLVDQAMSWEQANQYCQANYRALASIHSKDENDIAFGMCAASQIMNPCIDRFVDSQTCAGAEGCWIGMHQPRGSTLTNDEIVAFDNTGQCMVDHRISAVRPRSLLALLLLLVLVLSCSCSCSCSSSCSCSCP